MELVRKLESLSRRNDDSSRDRGAEVNKGRKVCFGGTQFSNSSSGRGEDGNINANLVEEIETILERETHVQEREISDVLQSRQQHKEFTTVGEENGSVVGNSISEQYPTGPLVRDKIASSSLEVEDGAGGLDMPEEGDNLLQVKDVTIAGAGQGLVNKEKQKGENLDKELMMEPLPLKSFGGVASIDGERDLKKSDRLRRVLRGRAGSAGIKVVSKALKKQAEVEEGFPLKKRRLASQGKLKEGDRVKVAWGGTGRFYSCKVVTTRQFALKVHYMGWGAEFDEWVPFPGNKVKLDI